jgi:hypothetical protein
MGGSLIALRGIDPVRAVHNPVVVGTAQPSVGRFASARIFMLLHGYDAASA